eukprot:GDKH01000540.1.p1 GENE.GDKH01000540.1~~GDKH01000540.1.p1  ORF type:complete len:124 (+),score=0.17 GDKH01000540.1:156-527(+)
MISDAKKREMLFGRTRTSRRPEPSMHATDVEAQQLHDNDVEIGKAADQVAAIKQQAIVMGNKIRESHKLLEKLSEVISSAQGKLRDNISSMRAIASKGGGASQLWMIVLFLLVLVLVMWLLAR